MLKSRKEKKKKRKKKLLRASYPPLIRHLRALPRMLLTSKQNAKKKKSFHWEETVWSSLGCVKKKLRLCNGGSLLISLETLHTYWYVGRRRWWLHDRHPRADAPLLPRLPPLGCTRYSIDGMSGKKEKFRSWVEKWDGGGGGGGHYICQMVPMGVPIMVAAYDANWTPNDIISHHPSANPLGQTILL